MKTFFHSHMAEPKYCLWEQRAGVLFPTRPTGWHHCLGRCHVCIGLLSCRLLNWILAEHWKQIHLSWADLLSKLARPRNEVRMSIDLSHCISRPLPHCSFCSSHMSFLLVLECFLLFISYQCTYILLPFPRMLISAINATPTPSLSLSHTHTHNTSSEKSLCMCYPCPLPLAQIMLGPHMP